jgi:AraC-like DNA-binding protein
MVVVDFRTPTAPLSFDGIRQIRTAYPRIILVAYVQVTLDRVREVFEAGRYGFDGLIVADQDDSPHAMMSLIEQAEARGLAAQVRRAVGDVNPTARDALLAAVSRSHESLSPDRLARVLGISRRLMARFLADARFPRPQRLLTWGRLIVAAHMLEDPKRSADSVAYALSFPSGSAFRNTCQRYLSSTPHEIRPRGGAAYAIAQLQAEIASGRADGEDEGDDDGADDGAPLEATA